MTPFNMLSGAPLGLAVAALLCAAFCACRAEDGSAGHGRVYIILWFDTEDYILPASDDAAKRVAEILTSLGVRATFKVVGEKARTLERRGRKDVIAALQHHEIGYHSNTHSQHPTPAEYEEPLGWESGVAEFTRRERAGFDDVARIFGTPPTCYGQPGSSWAPQSFPALRQWGVRVYLDEAGHVGLNGKPFWYGGLLNIFNTREGSHLRANHDWSNLEDAKTKFQDYYQTMTTGGGGIISIFFHPCEFVHREFWDGVNFAHGANPPSEEWKLPPLQPPAEQERRYKYLVDLVTYLKSYPQVRFVTASEALALYEDRAQKRTFTDGELAAIAGSVSANVSYQPHGDYALAPSEVFALLNGCVARSIRKGRGSARLDHTPLGPDGELLSNSTSRPLEVTWSQFARTVTDVEDYLTKNHRIPSEIWFGSTAASPESYLVALAQVGKRLLAGEAAARSVTLYPARLAAADHVARDSPSLWNWVIFPEGFHAPNLMSLAKLQAWTLKPAILHNLRQ